MRDHLFSHVNNGPSQLDVYRLETAMKRTRSQSSPKMSLSVDDVGLDDRSDGAEMSNGDGDDTVQNVVIAGAGPAGLMLA